MVSDEQLAGLWRAKLRRLARDHLGRSDGIDHALPWGAALESDGAWTVLIERSPQRSFGQALVLATRNNAESLDLLVEDDAASVARRAMLFDPSPSVWRIDDTNIAIAEPAEPRPAVSAPILAPHVAELLDIADVTIVFEHGEIIAECRGLEVGRVAGVGSDQRLHVGVGAYDQGAFAVINPDMTPTESLGVVVGQVMNRRRRGAGPHPLNRLARERWLLSELVADPGSLELVSLDPVEPAEPRDGIKETIVACALGRAADGSRVLVACSVGIDLDAVPNAADLAEIHDADRIVMVLPERDQHRAVKSLAARSKRPIEFVTAHEPWST